MYNNYLKNIILFVLIVIFLIFYIKQKNLILLNYSLEPCATYFFLYICVWIIFLITR